MNYLHGSIGEEMGVVQVSTVEGVVLELLSGCE